MEVDTILKLLPQVEQFDWGNFFLFKEYPLTWDSKRKITDYREIISQTDTTVRAVDDQYMYVYTPCEVIVNILKENYEIEIVTYDLLEKLPYPY